MSSKSALARVPCKSVRQECPAKVSSKRVLSRVPCKMLLLLDDCASHLHKEKTSIFIFAFVSVYSAPHKVTAFGFVGSTWSFFNMQQVSASAWDLAAGNLRGFSGTADNRQLLPLGVAQYDDHMLQHTDGRALRSLCDPEMGGPSPVKMLKVKEPKEILQEILFTPPENPQVSVLIDCGALLTGMSNREVAQAALSLCGRFRAAIYFDDDNQILVLDRDGRDIPLAKSPLQPVHECFTYLDDKHTRGTDLRFAPGAVGAVTICRKTTKDRLVQACMRMRSLGLGQKVMLFVDIEAGRQLEGEVREHVQPSAGLILAFVTARTAEELKSAVVHWALQGAAFATREPFLKKVLQGFGGECASLAKLCRESEDFQLSGYCQSLATRPSAQEIPSRARQTPKRILKSAGLSGKAEQQCTESADGMIDKQLKYLEDHELLSSEAVLVSSMDEEQEREREQEQERERELEIEMEVEVCPPPVQAHRPLSEKSWVWSHALQRGFVTHCKNGRTEYPSLHPITADELERFGMFLPQLRTLKDIPSNFFVTKNWLCSVSVADADCSLLEKAHSLRPVDAYLLSREHHENQPVTESIILLSGWEASQVLREMRYWSKHMQPERATQSDDFSVQLNHLSDVGRSMSVCPWGYAKLPLAKQCAVLKLFNGCCGFSESERPEIAKFLGLLEPSCLDGAAKLHLWNERQSRRLWDALRGLRVLSRNGFVKFVPKVEDPNLREEVEIVLERDITAYTSKMAWLPQLLEHISSRRPDPTTVVPEMVKFRLQGHFFQGSNLEEILDL